jgi:hypothetical protein
MTCAMVPSMNVRFVGGPADGHVIEDYNTEHGVATVDVPVPGNAGFGVFKYTLRKCKDKAGNTVLVLAPAGRQIDPAYLKANGLTN